jgi:hypothetical protein
MLGATGGLPPVKSQRTILTMRSSPYRKQVRHFNAPSNCLELAVPCYRRRSLVPIRIFQRLTVFPWAKATHTDGKPPVAPVRLRHVCKM